MKDPSASEGAMSPGGRADIDFNALLTRYHKKIFNVLYHMVGDYDEAADLTQDVFVQAYRAIDRFRGEAKIYTWLYRIAVNRGKNRMKQLARGQRLQGGSLDEPIDPDEGMSREIPDERYGPERILEQRELQEVVAEQIDGLPPDFRLVIVLRDMQGLSYRDMADVIGITVEAVKSRLFRARSELRERLRPYYQAGQRTGYPDPGRGRRGSTTRGDE